MTNNDVKGIVPKKNKEALLSIRDWMKKSTRWRRECINLIASENVVSPEVRAAMISDFGLRYAEGRPGKRYYQGTWMLDEIEIIGTELIKRLFNSDYADLMPLSGVVANTATLIALTNYGDKIMSLSPQDGAHISQTSISSVGVLGLKSQYLVFDPDEMNIDIEKSRKKILEYKPKLVITAGSVYLFPHPVKEIKEICNEIDAKVMYDGAHVAGLIAGKAFPDPLKEGCDVVTFSSHKTFPGPQGGMILCNNDLGQENIKKLKEAVFPKLISNHHLHHVAGKAITAAEMLEFGEGYAKQIIKNAKTLAAALYSHGFKVLGEKNGFTRSHQILVDISKEGRGSKVAESLEKANIICSKQVLPHEDGKFEDPAGIRIGTQEITRLGMKESGMDEIAEFIKRVVVDKENPESVKEDVVAFKKDYNQVHYCFNPGEAYDYLDKIYNSIQHWMK